MKQKNDILCSADIKAKLLQIIRSFKNVYPPVKLSHPYIDDMGIQYDILVYPKGKGWYLMSNACGDNAPVCVLENLTASELLYLYRDMALASVKDNEECYMDDDMGYNEHKWNIDAANCLRHVGNAFSIAPRKVASIRIRQILEKVESGTEIKFDFYDKTAPDILPLPYILNADRMLGMTYDEVKNICRIVVTEEKFFGKIKIGCIDNFDDTVAVLTFNESLIGNNLIPDWEDYYTEPGCTLPDDSVLWLEAWLEAYDRKNTQKKCKQTHTIRKRNRK